ncbi:MAG: glycosyltransferase family 4 protein [Rhodospirillaceae bacterium]
MHVWHIGAEASRASIGGVNFVVWLLAERQVAQGARVTMIVPDAPEPATLAAAAARGIEVVHVPQRHLLFDGKALRAALESHRPNVAVLHSVFLPRLIGASGALHAAGIPQMFMAHGALAEKAMHRSPIRKRLFVRFLERPRILRSAGVLLCTPSEAGDVRRVVPDYAGMLATLYNPIELDEFIAQPWEPPIGRPTALFIGRLDIEHKGIDRLFALAHHMPEMDFHLYGNSDPRYEAAMRALLKAAPPNLRLSPPIFGAEKIRAYAEATVLVQPSRWEGFPIIDAEAMAVGTPVAISTDVPLAQDLAAQDCGLLLPTETAAGVLALRAALADRDRLHRISANARHFAATNFHPDRQAAAHLDAYREAIAMAAANGNKRPAHGKTSTASPTVLHRRH